MKNHRILLLFTLLWMVSEGMSQSAFGLLSKDRNLSASNYCIYPDSIEPVLTDPPLGKKPFYMSHYGRHGSRYLNDRKGYDFPYGILAKADSLGKLTPLGQKMLKQLGMIRDDSEGRWGDLTGLGKQQHRRIATRMVQRFPEIFSGNNHVQARSTTVTRCVISMGAAVQQLVTLCPQLQISIDASQKDMWFMNHQDSVLRSRMKHPETRKVYKAFCEPRNYSPRVMQMLFNDSVYAREHGDEVWLIYYLIKAALIQQNTSFGRDCSLIDLFSYEEIHQFWQKENAWWYYSYGPSLLNGGEQHYTQRYLLRKMIEEADSCLQLKTPCAQLRFGHETVVLPLVCLLGINGFDFQTDDFEKLEPAGWWACLVFPMASNVQLVFYRDGPKDKNVLVKVLLNEREARLPLPDDLAPYYRWKDFRKYYLKKLDDYETLRRTSESASPSPANH